MEHCATRATSGLPHHSLLTVTPTRFQQFHFKFPASKISVSNFNPSGLRFYTNLSLRSSFSDETSSGASPYSKDGPDRVITLEETRPVDKNEDGEKFPKEVLKEDSSGEDQVQQFEFLEKLDIKFDSNDTYSILVLGGGVLVSLYLATAIVGAIDSIPLVPKLMQVVGLSYTLWFSTRYLLFKKNREELAAKIEVIKEQVLGSDDD
ncbi:hypothetical protein ACH5RR_013252 [Cinchona calisaya]|uniref:Cyanobacterial aminoacyl-tRNA synthetase CAAD domain-containing protein n=1 Tax=Cinchona calisaya TaxID=153742 RepID=A0ABD3A2W6_9GENT